MLLLKKKKRKKKYFVKVFLDCHAGDNTFASDYLQAA